MCFTINATHSATKSVKLVFRNESRLEIYWDDRIIIYLFALDTHFQNRLTQKYALQIGTALSKQFSDEL